MLVMQDLAQGTIDRRVSCIAKIEHPGAYLQSSKMPAINNKIRAKIEHALIDDGIGNWCVLKRFEAVDPNKSLFCIV